MATRAQFWGLMRWTGIQSGYTPEQMRDMRELLEAYQTAVGDLLAEGQEQGAIDLMRSLGVLTNPPRVTDVAGSQTDYQSLDVTYADAAASDEYALFRSGAENADDWSSYEEVSRDVGLILQDAPVPGVEYAYRVVAYNLIAGSASLPSAAVVIDALPVPQVLGAAATSVAAPVVTWTAVAPAPASYAIYRDGGLIEANATSGHADATAAVSTTYIYTVSATYLGSEGAQSVGASATTPA